MPSIIGWIKNGRKGKNLAYMPASYPSSRITHESVSVTADGVKTYTQLLNSLFALVDISKISPFSKLMLRDKRVLHIVEYTSTYLQFFEMRLGIGSDNTKYIDDIYIHSSNSDYKTSFSTPTSVGGNVPTSGDTFTLYY